MPTRCPDRWSWPRRARRVTGPCRLRWAASRVKARLDTVSSLRDERRSCGGRRHRPRGTARVGAHRRPAVRQARTPRRGRRRREAAAAGWPTSLIRPGAAGRDPRWPHRAGQLSRSQHVFASRYGAHPYRSDSTTGRPAGRAGPSAGQDCGPLPGGHAGKSGCCGGTHGI